MYLIKNCYKLIRLARSARKLSKKAARIPLKTETAALNQQQVKQSDRFRLQKVRTANADRNLLIPFPENCENAR